MNRTSWTLPPGYPHDSSQIDVMKAWCASEGIDASNVARNGFHITEAAVGTLTAHYNEFLRDGNGARYREDPVSDESGYAKRPVKRTVTSLPQL